MDRFAATTEHLRETACELLLRHGVRALTQDALARDGYVSVGSVYDRWSSRRAAIDDVAATRILPGILEIVDGIDFDSHAGRLGYLLDSEEGRRRLRLATEVLFAYRDDESLQSTARETLSLLDSIIQPPSSRLADGATWWLTSCVVGWGLLLAGSELPAVGGALAALACVRPESDSQYPITAELDVELPPSPSPTPTDAKGDLLKAHAREILASDDAQSLNTRMVTARAGVSTGAMYRRFSSRAELLRAILVDEIQSERYAWSREMIDALTGDDPLNRAVDVIINAITPLYDDRATQSLILELTIAARTESTVRDQLIGQILAAVQARSALFARLQERGGVTETISPEAMAWLFQAPPIGARLLASVAPRPPDETIRSGLTWIASALLNTSEN